MSGKLLKNLVMGADARLAATYLRLRPARPGLLIFAFHSLFDSVQEAAEGLMDPQQAITTCMFRNFVVNLREAGFSFVAPEHVLAGLDPTGHYVMITFDDGYANNLRALPVLEEFRVPAVFCISTNHVLTGKPFWWDVVYREGRKRGWASDLLDRQRAVYKRQRTRDAEEAVIAEFGSSAFQTVSDLDRPFTPQELARFAQHPLVHIGNHSCDHAILTNYSHAEAGEQIQGAQEALLAITGRIPQIVAFPNGGTTKAIVRATRDAGIRLGMTVRPGRNAIPQNSPNTRELLLKRYTLWGGRDIAEQCRIACSPFSLWATAATIRSKATLSA
jgi:peptidoglycan/xylan/chitin deacetylase (PgdA/CDA1 family)